MWSALLTSTPDPVATFLSPIFWTLPTKYLTGYAAAAGIGLINSLGNLGGFLAPILRDSFKEAYGGNAGPLRPLRRRVRPAPSCSPSPAGSRRPTRSKPATWTKSTQPSSETDAGWRVLRRDVP
jgi:hypothetical protein